MERAEIDHSETDGIQCMNRMVVHHGGGVNSNAMMAEMKRRGIIPDLILCADTEGERPEFYEGLKVTSAWCERVGFPDIVLISESSLEADCLRRETLPSIAFGFKTCSQRYKTRPQERFLKTWMVKGEVITKAIGFDAGEERRMKPSDDPRWVNWYPLIEWGLYREDCVKICQEAGLPTAKSSCFFCPSMKKPEILELKREHPELLERALTMERQAKLTSIKGLGRYFNWGEFVKADENQKKLFCDAGTPEVACGCYDG